MKPDYSKIPEIACKRKCGKSCTLALAIGDEIEVLDSLKPVDDPVPGMCSFLTKIGECSIYPQRPFACRLWSSTETHKCQHGCDDGVILLTTQQERDLFDEQYNKCEKRVKIYTNKVGGK